MAADSDPQPDFQRDPAAWLAQRRQVYWAEPSRARSLWNEAQPLFERLPDSDPALLVEFALLLCNLGYELRDFEPLRAVLARALPACEHAAAAPTLPRLLCVAARLGVLGRRYLEAATLLQRAGALLDAAAPDAPADPATEALTQGLLNATLGQLTLMQGQPERALQHAREAQRCYERSGHGGPWVHVYAAQAIALRELGRQDERRAVLQAGMAVAAQQRRWSEAANLSTGLFDMALEAGALDDAAQVLAEGEALAARAMQEPAASCHAILRCSRARLLARQGQFEAACALLEPQIDDALRYGGAGELTRRLDDLAAWQAQAGRGATALATSRRAQALRRQLAQEANEREGQRVRHQLEREQAERSRAEQLRHTQEAQAHKDALEAALAHLQALQEELAERSRQASLGALLAGVAHELNTPLGTALTALSSAEAAGQDLLQALHQGRPLSRLGLLAQLDALRQGHSLAARSLQRALDLTESYRPSGGGDGAAGTGLAGLVARAWQRALAPDSCLRLQLHDAVGAPCWPGQALEEVLVQLFQNIERHAYAPGEPGLVRVRAEPQARGALLAVEDQGRGIAPELLPRVFEPYVSTQFGRGRSGLGLFIAEAAVRQQLGGRLRVQSQPGRGARFEIECGLIGFELESDEAST